MRIFCTENILKMFFEPEDDAQNLITLIHRYVLGI